MSVEWLAHTHTSDRQVLTSETVFYVHNNKNNNLVQYTEELNKKNPR